MKSELEFAVVRSGLPSLFKSAIAMETGNGLVAKPLAAPNVPVPVPSITETKLEQHPPVVARSGLPSLLRSPIAIKLGWAPVVLKFVATPKVPLPVPRRIETLSVP